MAMDNMVIIKMGKNLNPKNSMVNIDTRFNQEELDKYAWRRNVLDSHIQTTQEARKVIEDSKTWRKRIERSWDEIREVTNIWNNYENKLKTALNNLSSRIEEFEKDQEDNKVKEETLEQNEKGTLIQKEENKLRKEIATSWIRNNFTKCTRLSEVRKRKKYIPNTTVHVSRII